VNPETAAMDNQFEAAGDMSDWPKNEHGKPTQAAVFGVFHPKKGKRFEILWTGKFPDLQPAMYWAAKKEVEAVRKGKWVMASRLLWQHDLTPEQALEVVRREMGPQVDRALRSMDTARSPGEIDIGAGPMQAIDSTKQERYVEISHENDPDTPVASFIVPPDPAPPEDPEDLPRQVR
jgi:hypothetical protein